MMTNKEINTVIKTELKEAGYNTKNISVSVKDSGYDTAIRIKIKSPDISRKALQEILHHWEAVERDERTHEILAGCNTYLFISYEIGIFTEVSRTWETTAVAAMECNNETVQIFDGLYLINLNHAGNYEIRQQNEKEHCKFNVNSFEHLSEYIYKFVTFGSIAA